MSWEINILLQLETSSQKGRYFKISSQKREIFWESQQVDNLQSLRYRLWYVYL